MKKVKVDDMKLFIYGWNHTSSGSMYLEERCSFGGDWKCLRKVLGINVFGSIFLFPGDQSVGGKIHLLLTKVLEQLMCSGEIYVGVRFF